jgi:RNA polymerase-associated protein LEO1
MDDVFGSDGESDREDLDPQNGQKTTSTPHDILSIDEDDDKNDPEPAKQPSLKEETRDIFGSDDDDEQELELDGENEMITEKAANPDIFVRKSQDDDAERDDLFGSDDDEEGDSNGNSNNFLSDNTMKKSTSTAPSHSKLCLPNIHRLSDGSQMLLKMPGFVKFQPKPYNPSTYDPEAEASLFNHAPDIIRWRYQLNSKGEIMKDVQGAPLRESNSRLVKWSDGTYQFLIGEETFEGQLVPVNDRSSLPGSSPHSFVALSMRNSTVPHPKIRNRVKKIAAARAISRKAQCWSALGRLRIN